MLDIIRNLGAACFVVTLFAMGLISPHL